MIRVRHSIAAASAAAFLLIGLSIAGPGVLYAEASSADQSVEKAGIPDRPKKNDLIKLLGVFPQPPQLKIDVLETVKLENGIRRKIKYLAEDANDYFDTPKDFIEAYLFIPDHQENEKLPAMIAIHQDGPHNYLGKNEPAGLAGDKQQGYGVELFERGYVVICPDRYYHGNRRRISNPAVLEDLWQEEALLAMEHWNGQLLLAGRTSMGKEVYDLMRSMDVLYTLECVDRERIGAIGHSAGGNAMAYFMFADPRVKLGASSCGLFELADFYNEKVAKKRYAGDTMPNFANVARTSDYLGYIAPRPFLMTRGIREWGTGSPWGEYSARHVRQTRRLEAEARRYYKERDADADLKTIYFDEEGGNHAFPPATKKMVYEWIDSYLKK
jgi:dienelactone hydrolase